MSNRWDPLEMLNRARTLFLKKVYACKKLAHANHEVHHLFRTQETWLPERMASVCAGTYYPRPQTRYYFDDDIAPKPLAEDAVALMLAEDIEMDSRPIAQNVDRLTRLVASKCNEDVSKPTISLQNACLLRLSRPTLLAFRISERW